MAYIHRSLERKFLKMSSAFKAVMVTGARQVGKTTIVRAFAKDNYTHFVEINFEKDPQAQEAFSGARDSPKRLLDSRPIIVSAPARTPR